MLTLATIELVTPTITCRTEPNHVWISDITYIQSDERWLHLAGIKNMFTCEIVGHAMSARMTQKLLSQALWKAVKWMRPLDGLILHTDRGSLKNEQVHHHRYGNRFEAKASIREYIESFTIANSATRT